MSNQLHMHRSSTSHSRSYINDIEEITDAELIRLVNDLKYQIQVLTLENEIFENTLQRLEPALLNGIQQALEYAQKIALNSSSSIAVGSFVKSQTSRFETSMYSPSKILTSPSRVSTKRVESSAKIGGTVIFGAGPRINVLERSELVSIEMEILVKSLERARKRAAKDHALLMAQLEEIGVRVTDIDKASEAFHQEVIVEGWDKIAQRIPAEVWIRYMTEWFKIADSQIGKLRLRTSTLNTQFSKLKGQIKIKAELSEQLRPVDFDKLKIDIQEATVAIDVKFAQLGELKKMTGDANLNLTVHKKAMWEQNAYLAKIVETIHTKKKHTIAIDKERAIIQVQADSLAGRLQEVKKVRNAYQVPDVMDYVSVKSELADLKHSVKLLENRVHIQRIALTSLNKKLRNMNTLGFH